MIFSCNNNDKQNKSISEIYNECYSKNVTVKDKSIKHFIRGFEKILIENRLLKDSTGSSYRDFLFEFSDYDYIDLKYKYSFLDSTQGLEYNELLNCSKKIKSHRDFKSSIFGKLADYMLKNDGNHEGYFESQPIDSIFNEKTFEFDHIKHKLFGVIKVYDGNKSQKEKVLYRKENYPKRAELKIDSKNRISWQNEIIGLNELSDKAYTYFLNYDNEKTIFLETSSETKYMIYITVQNELVSAKRKFQNKKSTDIYDKKYDDLTKSEKQEINTNYEFKVLE